MRFCVLGPLEAYTDGRSVPVGGGRQRALLALLLVHAGEVVSRDRLIEELWAGNPPPGASQSLDAYLSRVKLTRLTSRTIVSVPELKRALDDVRRNEFSVGDQELEFGLRSIAVPEIEPSGKVITWLQAVGLQRPVAAELEPLLKSWPVRLFDRL